MAPKAHPNYEDMVKAAILSLKDVNGSSFPAIAEFLGSNFKLPRDFERTLKTKLKNFVKEGKSSWWTADSISVGVVKSRPREEEGDDWVANMREYCLTFRSTGA